MSDGYVKRMLNSRSTLGVLREIPFLAGDFAKGKLTDTEKHGVAYKRVLPVDRMSYFDLRTESHPSLNLKIYLEDGPLSTTEVRGFFDHPKKLQPCYYLPYKKCGTTRMKLAPPPLYNGKPINFFTTATIDGCSVYVEGPADAPKVTHANAAHIAPPVGGRMSRRSCCGCSRRSTTWTALWGS